MKYTQGSEDLLNHVRALENKTNADRYREVLGSLKALGIEPLIQYCHFPKIKNIIIDSPPGSNGKRLLFSAHYDAVRNRPGANDNASGVAVLLGFCRELKKIRVPVRIIFFDREEAWFRTPFLRLGLLGSLYYAFTNNVRDINAVINLEYCGRGDCLSVWPVKNKEKDLPVVRTVGKVAADLKLEYRMAHVPWLLLSSDHLSFRFKGVSNSITLSLLPVSQLPLLENLISGLSVPKLLSGKRPVLPDPLSFVHTPEDTSSRISETSLQLMLTVLREIAERYGDQ